jgi:DNA-directed RNA polymerase beta subunit
MTTTRPCFIVNKYKKIIVFSLIISPNTYFSHISGKEMTNFVYFTYGVSIFILTKSVLNSYFWNKPLREKLGPKENEVIKELLQLRAS